MDCHVSPFHLRGLKLLPQKVQSIPFLENLGKFNLDLCIPRYRNSPQVSYLGMNPGRGWNPELEESHLPEYRESKAEIFTQGTLYFSFDL